MHPTLPLSARFCTFLDFQDEEWNRVIGVNLAGAFLMAQRVARVMAAKSTGSIVHISSIDAHARRQPGGVHRVEGRDAGR